VSHHSIIAVWTKPFQVLDFETAKRHPERSSISNVEIVSRGHKSVLQHSLLEVCERGKDPHAVDVKSRINFAGALAVACHHLRHEALPVRWVAGKKTGAQP